MHRSKSQPIIGQTISRKWDHEKLIISVSKRSLQGIIDNFLVSSQTTIWLIYRCVIVGTRCLRRSNLRSLFSQIFCFGELHLSKEKFTRIVCHKEYIPFIVFSKKQSALPHLFCFCELYFLKKHSTQNILLLRVNSARCSF